MTTVQKQDNAWAQTIKPEWTEVAIEPILRSKSGINMCPQSPDQGRHHWMIDAVCSQSIERSKCKWCGEILYD